MDDAEIARLRRGATNADINGWLKVKATTFLSLLDALEQARKERDAYHVRWIPLCLERDQAQKDAKDARALLGEAVMWVRCGTEFQDSEAEARALLTRIEAMLEQKQ